MRPLNLVLTVIIGYLVVAGEGAVEGRKPVQAQRWNILWISTEDISPDLGCYGDSYSITPNLDKFAREGMRYTNAFATAPVCAPSRSAIITGMYPTTIGSMHMRSKAVPPAGVKAFTEYLRAAGYYCTNNSKTDYNFEAPPSHRPPDSVWDETSATAHWRNRPDKSQPFFAVFNIMVTHESQVRVPDDQYRKNTARLTPEQVHDPARAKLPPYYPDTPLVRKDWARYYDNITAMDYMVGDLLKQLEDDGLAANTVVFFWGDHGRGLPRSKRYLYDSGLRVPLLVRWPGQVKAGSTNDDLVCLFDLGPTALSIAGVHIPAYMQARAILGSQKAALREYAFAHRDRMDEAEDMMRSVMGKRFHYIRNFHPDRAYAMYIDYLEQMPTMQELRRLFKDHMNALDPMYGKALNSAQLLFMSPKKPPEELYDVTADPHEIRNLAAEAQYKDVLQKMRLALDAWQRETKDLGSVPEGELRERMRAGGVWQKLPQPKLAVSGLSIKATTEDPGASIVYTRESGDRPRWKLYTSPVEIKGKAVFRFKACRFGFLDSDEVVKTVE